LLRYTLQRLLFLLPVMLGISVMTFFLIHITPGDPAVLIMKAQGVEPTPESLEHLRQEMRLDQPLYRQYIMWIEDVARLDLGASYTTGVPVTEEFFSHTPASLELALAAISFIILFSVPAGIVAALFRRSTIDHLSRIAALIGASMPSFWLGLLLIYIFAVKLHILPVTGRGSPSHLVLPAVTLGFGLAAVYARLLRASLLDVLGQEYIKVARAKGLLEKWLIGRHALKNALLPALTMFGISFGNLLGTACIVETVFSWPGIGKLAVDSIFNRDYPMIQFYGLFMAVVFVLANLAVDLSYALLDPRVQLERRS
jgi:peptide/nickel transport system permease protein